MGETTDVVSKEMYSFDDRSGDSITLRPEFTAGICRAFLSEGWQQFAPLEGRDPWRRLPLRAAAEGRYRQFHQLDAEIIGAAEPQADVELLALGAQLLAELGIGGVTLKLNTLGDAESRDTWRAELIDHFAAHRGELSEDSQERLEKNPLRILDSKDPRDRPFVDSAPVMTLSDGEAEDFFGKVRAGLDAAGVAYELDPHLVRGLDYYRHTAFEFVTDQLGAQGTVIAGGRYDGLVEQLGGPHTPAVGWAAGIERLAMMIDAPASRSRSTRPSWSRTMRRWPRPGLRRRGFATPGFRVELVASRKSSQAVRPCGEEGRARRLSCLAMPTAQVTRARQIERCSLACEALLAG